MISKHLDSDWSLSSPYLNVNHSFLLAISPKGVPVCLAIDADSLPSQQLNAHECLVNVRVASENE